MPKSLFPALAASVFLSGCSAKPDCDSNDARQAVIEAISSNAFNPLARYAAENTTKAPASNEKPIYELTQKLVANPKNKDKRTLQCSGGVSVLYGDLKATKEIEFTIQQASDGKLSVSVVPFQF